MADEENQGEARIIYCQKLSRELPGLQRKPFKNELGERIYENISQQAWQMWIEHSKMLVNEFRIDLMSTEGREFLLAECEKYFFGEGSALPPDFVPGSQPSK